MSSGILYQLTLIVMLTPTRNTKIWEKKHIFATDTNDKF